MADRDKRRDDDLLKQAQDRFAQVLDAESRLRELGLDDLDFLGGNQWPDRIKQMREADGTPALVINREPQFVRQITNQQRQNRISALVKPVDDKADVETAEVMQGIIRNIEVQSHAETAYETAGFYAGAMGWGYWRIISEYCDPSTFDQELRIKRIRNPFSVYLDPAAIEPDGSDAEFCFITEQLTKEEFERAYPDADFAALDNYMANGDGPKDWATGEEIRIAEYYYKEYQKDTLLLLAALDEGKRTDVQRAVLKSSLPEGKVPADFEVVKEREVEIPVIKWCKLNAAEILDETVWPGKFIPVVKVVGTEFEIDGKLHLSGVIRFTKDSQRQYNYMASAETEAIALEPRSPVVVVEGQLEGYEKQWKEAATRKQAYLQYRAVTIAGQPAMPPTRLSANPNIAALTLARGQAADDMKATAGIYDAQLGARANETSGRAILSRVTQSETSNYHYADNLKRSIEHSCRILVDAIPHFYDTARTVRIIGEEDAEKVVRVNEQFEDEAGQEKGYYLTVGKYDVVASSGPSFATRRQEAAQQLLSLAQAFPALMQVAGDLVAEQLDIPNAMKLANRLKKTLPPQLQDSEGQEVPPQAQMKLEQMGQMVEQLTAALNEAQKKLETKSMELESRERIEKMKVDAEMARTTLELDSKEAIELLKVEVENIREQLGMNVEREAAEASATAKRI